MSEMPTPPTLGSETSPPTLRELRGTRTFLGVLALIMAGLLAWHWIGGGAVWLGVMFAIGLVVCLVGALSAHGQLHGWDAPEGSDEDTEARDDVHADGAS